MGFQNSVLGQARELCQCAFTLTTSRASDEETESQANGSKGIQTPLAQSHSIISQLLSQYEGITGDITRSSGSLEQLQEAQVYIASKQLLRFGLSDIVPHSRLY